MSGSVLRAGLSRLTAVEIASAAAFTSFSSEHRVHLVADRLTSLLGTFVVAVDRVRVQNVHAIHLIIIDTVFMLRCDARFT